MDHKSSSGSFATVNPSKRTYPHFAMDTAGCRGRRKARLPLAKFWAFPGLPGPDFGSVQEWLEDLRVPKPWQSPPSRASSSSVPSSSSSSNSERTGSPCSWSSGATSFQELRPEKKSRHPRSGSCPRVSPSGSAVHKQEEHDGLSEGRSPVQDGAAQAQLQQQQQQDEKVQAKRSFSKFLDEVTSNVFDPHSLQALGRPASPSTMTEEEGDWEVTQQRHRPLCSMAQKQGSASGQETTTTNTTSTREEQPRGTYLETDIDAVVGDDRRRDQERKTVTPPPLQEVVDSELVIPPPPQFCQGFEMRTLFPEFHCRLPRHPYRSVSLPRGINMVS